MTTVLSTKGQVVLPAAARRKLKLARGERLKVELRDGGVFLRPQPRSASYVVKVHPVSGLPRMVADRRPTRKVAAAATSRLQAELL